MSTQKFLRLATLAAVAAVEPAALQVLSSWGWSGLAVQSCSVCVAVALAERVFLPPEMVEPP